ncbi:MAG: carboxypeptidase-like regulatory domain-containing protein, partial [Bacteroidetes bacterium]|nr:carboxypeptidase-like regulatory domain-containing protein [Bacteroidota bacterium]
MTKLYLLVKKVLPVVLLVSCYSMALAQGKTVSGRVTSTDDGSGVPGVNILEKGTSNGTVSDADGNYRITVGANATLVYSFVGYKTQE